MTAQALRTHRRHIEAVACDPAGVALPASSVTTLVALRRSGAGGVLSELP